MTGCSGVPHSFSDRWRTPDETCKPWADTRVSHRGQEGSATIKALAVALILVLVAAVATSAMSALSYRTKVQAALDVATLAAAATLIQSVGALHSLDPCVRASEIANMNGVSLKTCTVSGLDIQTEATYVVANLEFTVKSRAGPKDASALTLLGANN